ncbi:hypothetical protein [Geoglobus sp.]
MDSGNEVFRRVYLSLAVSFIFGLVLYFMLTGLYSIVTTMKTFLSISHTLLVFAVTFVTASVIIEHRSVSESGKPYYLVGGFVVAIVVTFLFVCTTNGVMMAIRYGIPPAEEFVLYLSILSALAFTMLKIVESSTRRY